MTVVLGVADITGYVFVAQEEQSRLTGALQTHCRDEYDGMYVSAQLLLGLDGCLGSTATWAQLTLIGTGIRFASPDGHRTPYAAVQPRFHRGGF